LTPAHNAKSAPGIMPGAVQSLAWGCQLVGATAKDPRLTLANGTLMARGPHDEFDRAGDASGA
jgi:hypothetical protein